MPRNRILDSAILTDGQKAVPLNALPPEAWTFISGDGPDVGELKKLYDNVPWLYRGVWLRGQAIPAIPFSILRGEEEIDTSSDYQNKLGWLPDPFTLLEQIEMDLTLHSRAYVLKSRNIAGRTIGGPRRLHPPTMRPKVDRDRGVIGFIRSINNVQQPMIPIEEMVYFALPDPWSELGHARSPAEAAMLSAGLLFEVDEFGSLFFKRGAVKVTLLTVSGSIQETEREVLETWWDRVVGGMKNAFGGKVINAERVEPVPIGEGISELSDQGLTKEKREDIATALGIPQSILFSTGAVNRAVSQQDDLNFYTKTMIPEVRRIERTINSQYFEEEGVRLQFKPQEMSIFQEDEQARSTALLNLIHSGETLDNAYMILGFDLPEEVSEQHEEEQEPIPPQLLTDLRKWRQKSLRQIKASGKLNGDFHSKHIPENTRSTITGALINAKTEDDVKDVFDAWIWHETA